MAISSERMNDTDDANLNAGDHDWLGPIMKNEAEWMYEGLEFAQYQELWWTRFHVYTCIYIYIRVAQN